jgi:hypothetical protein
MPSKGDTCSESSLLHDICITDLNTNPRIASYLIDGKLAYGTSALLSDVTGVLLSGLVLVAPPVFAARLVVVYVPVLAAVRGAVDPVVAVFAFVPVAAPVAVAPRVAVFASVPAAGPPAVAARAAISVSVPVLAPPLAVVSVFPRVLAPVSSDSQAVACQSFYSPFDRD